MKMAFVFSGVAALILLAGCSAHPPASPASAGDGNCSIDGLHAELGQRISVERVEQLRQRANAKEVRVLAPGDAATLDYNLQRLNIDIDEAEIIQRLSCG